MKRCDSLHRLEALEDPLRDRGVLRPPVWSVARGEQGADRDIDILVDLTEVVTIHDYAEVKRYIAK